MASRAFAFLVMVSLAAPAAAQEPWTDPRLRALARQQPPAAFEAPERTEPRRPLPDRPGLRRPPLEPGLQVGPDGRARVGVLVEMRGPGALADLRGLGAEIGTVIGRIASVRAPLELLPALLRLPSLVRVEAAPVLQPLNDDANRASRVDRVRRREGAEFLGSTGRGVVIGVIDTGLDYLHGDFLDDDGVPRALAIWDQQRVILCDRARIVARACGTTDDNGHGSHVTGIAAGDGSDVGLVDTLAYAWAGVAPEADIVAVRYSFASNADLVDGVAWMFDQAAAVGKPAVVNISLGSQFGPHDGTALMELALDSLSGPGRIVVTSAGNDGNARNTTPSLLSLLIHGKGSPGPAPTPRLSFEISNYTASGNTCNDQIYLEIWYPGDQDVTFTVIRPGNTSASGTTGQFVVDDHPNGQVYIDAPATPYPGNGDRNALIRLSGCDTSGSPAPGGWELELSADAASPEPVHVWLAYYTIGGYVRGIQGFDNTHVVSTPGTARQVITVGAYASRLCWPSPNGELCSDNVYGFRQAVGDIAFFSSGGPTRDGRLKPDIAAPGMFLMSTASGSGTFSQSLQSPDRRHRIEAGTSMSSPHVAGAVALLLQHEPTLTPDSVRAILAATAATDNFTAFDRTDLSTGEPNEQWGWGKLDARAALATLVDSTVVADLWISVRTDTLPLGATLPVRGLLLNALGDSIGVPGSWSSSAPGVAAVTADGTVTPVSLGTATITATDAAFSESLFIEVVPPATLVVTADPALPPSTPTSRAGTRIPLIDLRLAVDGFEGVLVDSLGFDVSGRDPGARFLLAEDLNDNGRIDAGEPLLADTAITLAGEAVTLLLAPALVIPAQDSVDLVAGLLLSGAVPNGATFQAIFRPDLTSSEGIRSGEADRRTDPAAPVASLTASTTLLEEGETFNLSENPVRSDARRLVLNFVEAPTVAAIYTLRGLRVVDLLPRLDASGVRAEWDLTTDQGGTVAPGIYFLVVRVGDELIRRKLIVARAFGGDDA